MCLASSSLDLPIIITESQNHLDWVRPLRSSSPTYDLTPPPHYLSDTCMFWDPHEPFVPQANHRSLSFSLDVRHSSPFIIFVVLCWTCCSVCMSLLLGAWCSTWGFPVLSREGESPFQWAGTALPRAAQGAQSFLCCEGHFLVYLHSCVPQEPGALAAKLLFIWSTLNSQELIHPFTASRGFSWRLYPNCPCSSSNTTISFSSQFCITCKLAKVAACPTSWGISGDLGKHQSQNLRRVGSDI